MDSINNIEELPQHHTLNQQTESIIVEDLQQQSLTYHLLEPPHNNIIFETTEELELKNLLEQWNLVQIYPHLKGK